MKALITFLFLFLTSTFLAQTLTISSMGQTGISGSNWSVSGTNPVTVTATGAADINTSVIEGYLNLGNSVFLETSSAVSLVQLTSSITKSSGSSVSFTIKSGGRILINQPVTATVGSLDVVLWSDWDNDNDDGGVSILGSINTNNGHFWAGGSTTNNGSYTWNGLAVGDGPSIGSNGSNNNALDIYGDVLTGSGDFLAWAGNGYSSGISGLGTDGILHTVGGGSGDIIVIANEVLGPTNGGQAINFVTTGHFYLTPFNSAFNSNSFNWFHTTGANANFSSDYDYMQINNITSLTGLTIGKYSGLLNGLTPVELVNSSYVMISSAINVAGPISVYGNRVDINADIQTTQANQAIKLVSKGVGTGNLTNGLVLLATNTDLTTNGGDIIVWSNAENSTTGQKNSEIILAGTNQLTSNGGKIVLAGGLDDGANGGAAGDGIPDGYAYRGGYSGEAIDSRGDVSINSDGGDIIIRGQQEATDYAIGLDDGTTINSGTGNIDIRALNSGNHAMNLASGNYAITSASTDANAINISASTDGSNAGIVSSFNSGSSNALIQTTSSSGGGITIQANNGGSGKGFWFGHNDASSTLQILSNVGNINLFTNAEMFVKNNTLFIGNRNSATAVQGVIPVAANSSSDIVLKANDFVFENTSEINLNSSGTLTIEPFSSSFTDAQSLSTKFDLGNNFTGITYGKVGNTVNLTIPQALIVTGPISVYGGNITVNGNLTSSDTTGVGINLISQINILGQNSNITTNGADVLLSANSNNNDAGRISLNNLDIITNGGNIALGGSTDGNGFATGTTDVFTGFASQRGIWLNDVLLNASGTNSGGNIQLKGKGNPAEISSDYNIGVDIVTNTEIKTNNTGAVSIYGVGGPHRSADHGAGINFFNQNSIHTTSGNVLLDGTSGGGSAATARLDAGINFDGGGSFSSKIYSTSGDITLIGRKSNLSNSFGIQTGSNSSVYIGTDGTTATTGDVALNADNLSLIYTTNIETTGSLTVQSIANTFSNAITFPSSAVNLSNTISELTIGKTTNTADVTFGANTTIAGPISVYGGDITLNDNITSQGDISIFASENINTDNSSTQTITSNNHNIRIYADANASGNGILDLDFLVLQAGTGDIIIRGETLNFATGVGQLPTITNTTGSFTLEPSDASFFGSTGGNAVRTTWFDYPTTLNGFTIGKLSNTQDIIFDKGVNIPGPISAYGGTLEINAPLTAVSSTINIMAATAATQTAALTASNLSLNGTGSFTLQNNTNNVAILAAGSNSTPIGNLSYKDNNALEIGTVGSQSGIFSSGIILVETDNGNLTLSQNLNSTSTSDDAIILNAGKSSAANSGSGGNIIVTGTPTLTYPAAARAKLYSGVETPSTGLTNLVGGIANTRSGFDENSTITPVLADNNAYAIYRFQSGTGDLTIVGSGGDAINSTWSYSSGVITTISSPVNLNSSIVEGYLATGDLTITAGNIIVDADVNSTTANNLTLKAKGNITQNTSKSITTDGGDIIFWADSDNDNLGNIDLSGAGQTLATNGGDIIMGGGSGTTIPNGFANGGTSTDGVALGSGSTYTTVLDTRKTGNTAGNIVVRGKTSGNFDGIYVSNAQFFAHDLTLNGESSNASNYGVRLGSSNVYNGANVSHVIDIDNDLIITGKNTASNYSGNVLRTGANPRMFVDGNITFNSSGKFAFGTNQSYITVKPTKTFTLNFDGTASFATPIGNTNSGVAQGDVIIQSNQQNSFTSSFDLSTINLSSSLSSLTIGKTTNTSDVTFGANTTIAGPITTYGRNININGDLNTSSVTGGDILLKASGNIEQAASKSIVTNGGNVVLWANSDNESTFGSVALRNGSSIITGSSSVTGGHVWIGGGSNGATWNGLSVGSGYAVSGTSFTPSNGGSALRTAVYFERNSISTFGGNIKIAGNAPEYAYGIATYGNTIELNSGNGTIELDGEVTGNLAGTNRNGIVFGVHDVSIASTVNIKSSAASGDAITLNGVGRGTGDGIGLSGTVNLTASGGGNIIMTGDAKGTGNGIVTGSYYHGKLNVFASTGDIKLNGGDKAIQVAAAVSNGSTSGPSKITLGSGGTISSSTSDVFITADNITLAAGGIEVNTSGELTLESSSPSFASALTFPITNSSLANTISRLTLGKSTNTADVTIGANTTIAGPITTYGGNININGDLNTAGANDADILLKASGNITQNTSKSILTDGGNVTLWSNSDSNGGYILLNNGSTITTNGGHLWMGGSATNGASTTWNGLNVGDSYALNNVTDGVHGGIQLGTNVNTGISLSSGGGDILLRGKSTQGSTSNESNGIHTFGGFTIDAGTTGDITLDGQGKNGTYNAGIYTSYTLSAGNNLIKTVDGDILLTGTSNGGGSYGDRGILLLAGNSSSTTIESTGTGSITINANSGSSSNASHDIFTQNIVNILANSGAINITGSGNGDFQSYGNALSIGYKASSDVTSSSGNISIKDDKLTWGGSGSWQIKTSGTAILQPYRDDFSSEISTANIGFSTDITELTIGKSTNKADITIASITNIAGPITAYGGDITVNGDLNTAGANDADILLKASGNITTLSSKDITTNGGNITLWADRDSLNGGYIEIGDQGDLNSNGGDITLSGGNDLLTGYANGNGTRHGIRIGSNNSNTNTLNSDGGDILMRGYTPSDNSSSTYLFGVMLSSGVSIDGGTGSVSIFAKSEDSYGFNISEGTTAGVTIQSAKTSGTAITLDGWSDKSLGLVFNYNVNKQLLATGGGDISLKGITTASSYGIFLSDIDILASSGTITIDGGSKGITTGGSKPFAIIGSKIGDPNIASSSSNVHVISDVFNFSSTTKFNTTGSLTLESAGTSFSNPFNTNNFHLSFTLSGLTIGKQTNISDVTFGTNTTIAGPITAYGGTVSINAPLTAESSTISISATTAASQTAALTASNLSLNGAGSFALQNNLNNIGTLSAGSSSASVGNISYLDSNELEIGTVGSQSGIFSSGTILVETDRGNLTLSQNINTTSTSDDAIILNAGKTKTLGTMSGGDIILSGTPTLTFPSTARAKLFSGSALNSTGLTNLVGGDSNVLINLDETSSLIGKGITDGKSYAIYRSGGNPPDFNSPSLTYDVVENTTSVTNFNANDGNGGAIDSNLVYTISGLDSALFTLDSTTGLLSFSSAPNYENPLDTNTDNIYSISVTADNGLVPNNLTTIAISVTVTDINEAPSLTTNTGTSVINGCKVTLSDTMISVTDPDDTATGLTFTITTLPVNGVLVANGNDSLLLSDTFTQADIINGIIEYLHNGSATTSDVFSFSLADGEEDGVTPLTNQNFNITVTPADDASFDYSATTFCVNESDPTVTVTGLTGGTFSSSTGLSLNTATGTIDLSASTPGTYSVTYTTAGTCQNSSTVSVTINAMDDASFSYSAAAFCVNESDPTLTVTGLTGGTFSSTTGLALSTSTGTIDLSASTPGTYSVTYTTAGTCPNSSSVSVTINAMDDASFGYSSINYCANETDPTATVTGLTGGTFSSSTGLSLNTATGTIDLSASTPGTYSITYTTAGTCPNSSSVSVTINAMDDASFNYSAAAFCVNESDPTATITGLTGGTFSSTTGLSLNTATGTIDLSASTPGTYSITYTTAGTCPNSSSVSVTINAMDDASFNYSAAAFCVNESDPTATITGLTGGTFSSTTGLSLNTATGTIDLSASTPGTYSMTYTTAGTCPNSSTVSVTINAMDDASFSYSAAAFCVNQSDPNATVTGLTGGTFSSSTGLSLNTATGTIDLSASTPGTYSITYTTAGTCPNSSSVSVTINAMDDASFNYSAAAFCVNESDPTATITGLTGGTFSSTTGLSLNTATGTIDLSAFTPGTYSMTYTTAGTCQNSSTVSVTINAMDDASFSYSAAAFCVNQSDPNATVTGLTGGTFSSSTGLSLNTATGTIDLSASTPGTYSVTYTTAGTCPNSSTVSVTINAMDDASFSYSAAAFCVNESDPIATVTGLTGGTFSSSTGLSLNTATGTIDLSASTPGTYSITYTTAGTCPNSSSVSVTINAMDDASFSYSAAAFCVNQSDPIATVTGLTGGTFSSSTGLSLNTATGTIDLSASNPGTYSITYTTAGTCPNSSTVSVTINAMDDASFSYSAAAFCVNESDPTATITGLTGGTFSSSTGLSLNTATGTIDLSASTPGTYSITYTTAGTCPNSSSVSVTINVMDDASFNYSAAAFCVNQSDPIATVTGLTGGTFSSSTGLSLNTATGTIDLSASTPGTYSITYTTAGTCPNSSSVSVTINAMDDASFSYSAAAFCVNQSDPIATVTGLTGGMFSSSTGLSLNTATGTIDLSASTPGTYSITYTTAGTCPNSSSVSVTINAMDDASFNYSAAAFCVNESDPTATVTGLTGGTFSSSTGLALSISTGTIDLSASTPGTYLITYTTAGTCPNSSSVSVTINDLNNAAFNYNSIYYCVNDTDPTAVITGNTGGNFSAAVGLILNASNGTIDLSASIPGSYVVTYKSTGFCPNIATVSVPLIINDLDDASFSYANNTYGIADQDPTPIITGLAGGSFSSTAGLAINANTGRIDLSASAIGTYTVTYTTAGPCINSSNFQIIIDQTSSISEEAILSSLALYPNPARDVLYIKSSSLISFSKAAIYDLQGRLIRDVNVNTIDLGIQIDDLETTYYLIVLHTTDNQKVVKQFIKH